MSSVYPGRGIVITNQTNWIGGHEIQTSEISIGYIDLENISVLDAKPGEVLMYERNGGAKWKKPFDSDKELRQEYPALEEAWGTLMEALEEYQMVKKLVMDHDK